MVKPTMATFRPNFLHDFVIVVLLFTPNQLSCEKQRAILIFKVACSEMGIALDLFTPTFYNPKKQYWKALLFSDILPIIKE